MGASASRRDAIASTLVSALGEHGAGLAEAWTRHALPARLEGDVARVGVGATSAGRSTVLLDVAELGAFVALTAMADGAPRPRFAEWQVRSQEQLATLAPEIARVVRSWAAGHPGETNVIDVAYRARALLEARFPSGVWSVEFWPSAYGGPAGASINLRTGRDGEWRGLVGVEPLARGVVIRARDGGSGRVILEREAVGSADADALGPDLVDAVRGQLEARERFASRVFKAGDAARAVQRALAGRVPPDGGGWHVQARDGSLPAPRPWACVYWGAFDAGHHVAVATEDAHGVRVAAGAEAVVVRDAGELAAATAEIVAAIERQLGRLTVDRLVPGRRYRLLRPLGTRVRLEAGAVVRLVGSAVEPREGYTVYSFRDEATGVVLEVTDVVDADLAVLRDLDEYLQPLPST